MQEEVENRSGQSGNHYDETDSAGNMQRDQEIRAAPRKSEIKKKRRIRRQKKPAPIRGKQTVKQLIGQNQGVSSVDIAKSRDQRF